MTWIHTHTGRVFDLVAPTPEMVEIEDIAHALAHLCRYTGHAHHYYSVAEHCCHVEDAMVRRGHHRLYGLLHDAAEAYVGDVAAPLKRLLPEYRRVEKRIEDAVRSRYELGCAWRLSPATNRPALPVNGKRNEG